MNNLDMAITDLIDTMTRNEPGNVMIQLSIRFPHSDKQPHTETTHEIAVKTRLTFAP